MFRFAFIAFTGGCFDIAISGSKNACYSYTDSFNDCMFEATEAGLTPTVDETDCDNQQPRAPYDVWACRSNAYDNGDCTTQQGLLDIEADYDACGS